MRIHRVGSTYAVGCRLGLDASSRPPAGLCALPTLPMECTSDRVNRDASTDISGHEGKWVLISSLPLTAAKH